MRLYDSDAAQLDAAREHIETGLTEQQAYGLADDAVAASARIDYVTDLDQALAGVDWVQENTPEVLDVKREMYPRIDRATPATAIVASSTSAIPASRVHRGSSPDARAASSRIRSTRRISCRWSSCAVHRGPRRRRWSAPAR